MPKGRNETGPNHSLTDWAQPHNMYRKGGEVEANGRYHARGARLGPSEIDMGPPRVPKRAWFSPPLNHSEIARS